MLLRFSVRNYLSFKDEQELSLLEERVVGPSVATTPVPKHTETDVLPAALIYGANASGKSNLLKAFRFYRNAILRSHTHADPEGGVPRVGFRLTPHPENLATELEADFVVEGVRHTYGFKCNDESFFEEWLFSFPEGKRRKLFERSGDDVEFGSYMTGQKKNLVPFMRSNSLFISTATQNDHPELSGIVRWFRSCLYSDHFQVSEQTIQNAFKKGSLDKRVIKFMEFVGTGVTGFRESSIETPEEVRNLAKEFVELARKRLGNEAIQDASDFSRDGVSIELSHRGEDEQNYFLELSRESSGTRRLLMMMRDIFRALDSGSLVMVDELDASLHTRACEEIVRLFQNKETNPHGAQLVATTHDTNLLSSKVIRRDQIWFCERDGGGASTIYPLSDMKSRPNDNFEKGYLQGRYGAVPFSGDIREVFAQSA